MNEKAPLVSVVVPNYNYARYLDARLSSILNQTFQDFELILLDDASTDNSLELLDRYKNDPHVSHFIVNEQNTGSPFKQWMKGILLAKGEWVWIAEADDLCEPTFLETCVEQVQKYPNVSVCMTAFRYIDEKVIYCHKKPIIGERRNLLYLPADFREELMQSITCIGIVVLPMPVAYCFAVLMLLIYPILPF